MAKLSGFADEVSSELDEQIAGLKVCGIGNVALRGCFGKNIMEWTDAECYQIKKGLDVAGIGVSEIGSPIGKTPIDDPFEKTQAALDHAIRLAELFETPNIRLFSFYPPAVGEKAGWEKAFRGEVLRRLTAMADQAAGRPVTLMLENESELYGDYPAECLDIFSNVRSEKLRMAFDFANFVSRKPVDVYGLAWKVLKPFVGHIHVKDWVPGENAGRVAGQGQGQIREILAELATAEYNGFLTLEPHLSKAGQFAGFSGLDKFKAAADALIDLCRQAGLKAQ
jgi:sugar phosphate isomerase/epimerase